MHPYTLGFIVGLALIGIGLYCLGKKNAAPKLGDGPDPALFDLDPKSQPAPLAVLPSPPPAEFVVVPAIPGDNAPGVFTEQRPPPGLATTPPAELLNEAPVPAPPPGNSDAQANDPHAAWLAAARAARCAGPCPPSTQ